MRHRRAGGTLDASCRLTGPCIVNIEAGDTGAHLGKGQSDGAPDAESGAHNYGWFTVKTKKIVGHRTCSNCARSSDPLLSVNDTHAGLDLQCHHTRRRSAGARRIVFGFGLAGAEPAVICDA
jgi:hypothetical protein